MTTRPAHLGIRHLALFAHAFDDMRSFYIDVLGFGVEWAPDPDNVYLSSGADNLALHRTSVDYAGERGPLDHLGLLVGRADDVDRWASYLVAQGIALKAGPKTHRDGARSLYVCDPDGNAIQIIYHPAISSPLSGE